MDEVKPFVITIVGAESSGKTTLGLDLATETGSLFLPEFAREYLSSLGRDYDEKDLEIIAEKQWEIIEKVVSRESSDVSPNVSRESSGVSGNVRRVLRPSSPLPGATAQQPPSAENPVVRRESSVVSRESFDLIKSKFQIPKSKIIIDGGMMNLRMWARIKYGTTIPVVEEALRKDVTDLYLLCRPRTEWVPDPLREAPTILERAWIYNQYLKELSLSPVDAEIVF